MMQRNASLTKSQTESTSVLQDQPVTESVKQTKLITQTDKAKDLKSIASVKNRSKSKKGGKTSGIATASSSNGVTKWVQKDGAQ